MNRPVRMFRCFASLVALALPLADARPAQSLEIPVRLERGAEVRDMDWPLVVNVPFARGEMRAGQAIALRQDGNLLPTQARTLVTWPDGSLRWVRLDAILPRRAPRAGTLEVVAAAPRHQPRR